MPEIVPFYVALDGAGNPVGLKEYQSGDKLPAAVIPDEYIIVNNNVSINDSGVLEQVKLSFLAEVGFITGNYMVSISYMWGTDTLTNHYSGMFKVDEVQSGSSHNEKVSLAGVGNLKPATRQFLVPMTVGTLLELVFDTSVPGINAIMSQSIMSIRHIPTVVVTVPILPTLTIAATDALATEATINPGEVTISSDQVAGVGGLTVVLVITGTATSGTDYVPLPTTATILQGESTVVVPVTPVDDVVVEVDETVIVTIVADTTYTVGINENATVVILSDDGVTLDPANTDTQIILSNVNLTADKTETAASWHSTVAGLGRSSSSGNFQFEVTLDSINSNGRDVGLGIISDILAISNSFIGSTINSYVFNTGNGSKYSNGSGEVGYDLPPAQNTTIAVKIDFDLQTIEFLKDNVSLGVAFTSINVAIYFPALSLAGASTGTNTTATINFGDTPFVNTLAPGYTSWDGSQTG